MKVNPSANLGFGAVNAAKSNKNSSKSNQMAITVPIRDTFAFSGNKTNIQEKPLGARISQAIGKLMHDVLNLPQKLSGKGQTKLPAAGSLNGKGLNGNIYEF